MRRDVDARLAAIAAELERRRLIQEEAIDPLSASLFAFEDEMASLDEIGVAALAAETDEDGRQILTLEQAQRMVDGFKQDVADRRLCAFKSGV